MAEITVRPLGRPPKLRLELPGSTSAGVVATAAAALADGLTTLQRVPMNATLETMVGALRALGAAIQSDERSLELRVRGCGGHPPVQEGTFDCGADPLVAHLVIGLCAFAYGQFRVDSRRQPDAVPVRAMVDALRDLGGHVGYDDKEGYLPVNVRALGIRGGQIVLHTGSSEALIALLTVAPYARTDVFIESARRTDVPSVAACCEMISRLGVSIVQQDFRRFIVPAPQRYCGGRYTVPPSSFHAALMWMVAAMTGGSIRIVMEHPDRVGSVVAECFERLGAHVQHDTDGITVTGPAGNEKLRGAELDLEQDPELIPIMALTALKAREPTRIVAPVQEEFVKALAQEIAALGAKVDVDAGALSISPPETIAWRNLDGHESLPLSACLAAGALAADRPVTITGVPDADARRDDPMETVRRLSSSL